jgi:undecaprenyl-diphosphatase
MNLLQAVVLGVVQGVTEFLPISSTAHLRIVPALLGWGDPGAAFSAIIQLGTVAACIIYFWKDLFRLAAAFFRGLAARAPFGTPDARLAWYVIIGTIPVGVVGLVFKKAIETSLRSLYIIAASMTVLALVLLLAEKLAQHRRQIPEMTMKDGIIIGLCQAVALIPGSSRSGTTLTGGLALGFKREDAARYSFLLSIPANAAAGVFQLKQILHATERPSTFLLAVGTVVSFVVGMAAIAGLLRYLRTRTTLVFVAYRLLMGGLLFALLFAGVLQPLSGT